MQIKNVVRKMNLSSENIKSRMMKQTLFAFSDFGDMPEFLLPKVILCQRQTDKRETKKSLETSIKTFGLQIIQINMLNTLLKNM